MSTLKGIVIATSLALLTTTAAYAQKVSKLGEGATVIYNMEGETAYGNMTDKGKAAFVANAKPLGAGVVIFRHDGKLYMMEDPGGKYFKGMGEYLGN